MGVFSIERLYKPSMSNYSTISVVETSLKAVQANKAKTKKNIKAFNSIPMKSKQCAMSEKEHEEKSR